MRNTLIKTALISSCLAISTFAHAQALPRSGTVTVTIKTNTKPMVARDQLIDSKYHTNSVKNPTLIPAYKRITLLQLSVTPKIQQNLKDRLKSLKRHVKSGFQLTSDGHVLPKQKQLGMNGVPVLNQGHHGSCATFANTAAVDAVLGKGDYVSQLCSLQLGQTLEQYAYIPSGWDGSDGELILNQIMTYGIVSKEKQQQNGCGGMSIYPLHTSTIGDAMSLQDYHSLSESVSDKIYFAPLPSTVVPNYATYIQPIALLKEMKAALAEGDRVTIGTMMTLSRSVAGATGHFKTDNDTWVLSANVISDLLQANPEIGGHEMVITGYDDDATLYDELGIIHRGIFTLRNSWGSDNGDNGTYYMTYDYLQFLVMEAHRVTKPIFETHSS